MATATSTRDALLHQGALLFARQGVAKVTARELHEAVGARNESALHYHFGGRDGLLREILRLHLEVMEERRARLVAVIAAEDRVRDLRALVHALAAPMADDLPTEVGRAHLQLVAQFSHPRLGYDRPFRLVEAAAGKAVVRWLTDALDHLPDSLRLERLLALRVQLISLFGQRAQLLDEQPGHEVTTGLFLPNLVDMAVAALAVAPSAESLEAADESFRIALTDG